MAEERDYISAGPFTPEERQELRRIVRDEAYSRKFWATSRLWLGWSIGAVLTTFTLWDRIKGILPWVK